VVLSRLHSYNTHSGHTYMLRASPSFPMHNNMCLIQMERTLLLPSVERNAIGTRPLPY